VVCQKCKHPYTPSESLLDAAGITPEMAANATFAKGAGCGNCSGKGFRGRLGIFELMLMSPKIRELTFNSSPTEEIRRMAIGEGMKTLYWDGIDKVLRGVTTLEEVLRVAKQSE